MCLFVNFLRRFEQKEAKVWEPILTCESDRFYQHPNCQVFRSPIVVSMSTLGERDARKLGSCRITRSS